MVAGRLLSGCEGPDAAVARACPEGSRQSLSAVRCGRSFQVVRRYGFGRDRIGSRRVQRSTDRSFTASAATTRTARKTTTVAGGRASTSTGIAAGRSNGKPKKGSVLENRKDGQIRLTIAGRPSLCFDRTSGTWTDPETSGAGSGISTIEQASKHGQGQKPELQQPDTNAPVRTAEERTCPGSRYSGCGTGRCARLPADSGRHAV